MQDPRDVVVMVLHSKLALDPVADHVRKSRTYGMRTRIFLNAHQLTYTVDDHLAVVLRNSRALWSGNQLQGFLLALRNAHATTDASPGLEV